MGIKKFILDKTNLIYALPTLAALAIVGIWVIEEQKKEWRIFPSEGVVFYDSSIEKEIQEFNEHFQEVRAKWEGKDTLFIHSSGPYIELGHTLKARHKLEDRREMLNFAKIVYLNIESIEGLESLIVSGDFHLRLYKQENRSWEGFMQDLIVVLDKYIE